MSQSRTAGSAAHRVGSGAGRLLRAWRSLPYERRLAAIGALGLFVTLFLPWYQETVVVSNRGTVSTSVTGWGAFSFVEAAVLLVAVGVLTLLFQRAEGRAFHLPGGDGWVIMLAGFWTCALVVWRMFDKQAANSHQQISTKTVVALGVSGIEWGIFVALAVAAFLTYTGARIRAAHRPEPPLPGDPDADGDGVIATEPPTAATAVAAAVADPPVAERPTSRAAGRRGRRTGAPPPEREADDEPAQPTQRPRQPRPRPRPAPAPAPAPSSPEDGTARRTGWLTARPEGMPEPLDPPQVESRGWSYDDVGYDAGDEPADDADDRGPEVQPTDRAVDQADDQAQTVRRRRRRPPPDDQLTIRLDRDD